MAIWGSSYVVIQSGLRDTTPLLFSSLRALPAGVVLVCAALVRDCPQKAAWRPGFRDFSLIALLGVLTTTVFLGTMFWGTSLVGPGLSSVLINTQPLIVAFLARIWLGERLTPWQWVFVAVGFLGIVLIAMPSLLAGQKATLTGIGLLLTGALSMSAAMILAKPLYQRQDLYWATGWQLIAGGVLLLGLAVLFEDPGRTRWTFRLFLAAAYLSLVGTAAAALIWFSLIRIHSVSRLATFGFLIPVFGVALAWVIYGERINAWSGTGIGLTVGALYYMGRTEAFRVRRIKEGNRAGSP